MASIIPKKILVIKFRSLGDTVIMTAALDQLRKSYPRSQIHVAVTSNWADILEHHPAVNKLWRYERRSETAARAKTIARLCLKMRKEKYDAVLNFHASPSSSMLAFGTGAKTRAIHYHGHQHKNRYSTVEISGKGKPRPAIERDMDAVRALGLRIPEDTKPSVYLTDEEKARGAERIQSLGLSGPVVAIGLGASRPTKQWPVERFAEFADKWRSSIGGSCIPIASPEESDLKEQFLSLNKASYDLGNLSVRELGAVIHASDLYFGNDSGPKHLAVALNRPTVSVLGPEDPYEWHPYSRDEHPYLYIENLTCRKDALAGMPPWCGLHTCEEEKHRCMQELTVEQAFPVCEQALNS